MNRRKFLQTAAASPLAASFATLVGWQEALERESKNWLRAYAPSPISANAVLESERCVMPPAIVPPDQQFMASLPRLMELAQLPGLGMGIVHGDRLVWQHYAGLANAVTKAPITGDSLFPAASMGKPVFAYAVLQLVDEHHLDLDRPLKDYLSEDAPTGELGARITARHILSHSSGLPNWRWESGQSLIPAFEPGTKFRYSGEGFYYLQRCVEKITGVRFEQFMQSRMFKPLGITSSTYLWRADAGQRLVPGHRGDEPFDNRAFAEQLFYLIEKSGCRWHNGIMIAL